LVVCDRCGTETTGDLRFCRKCGARLPTAKANEIEFSHEKRAKAHRIAWGGHFSSPLTSNKRKSEEKISAIRPPTLRESSAGANTGGTKIAVRPGIQIQPFSEVTKSDGVTETKAPGNNAQALVSPVRDESEAVKLKALVQRIQELDAEIARLNDRLWRARGRPSKLLAIVMLVIGSITLVSSAIYSAAILAFVGLGLAFWGGLLLQIRPARFVNAELVESTAQSSIIAIDRLLDGLGPIGSGIYLPGEGLQATVVFLPLDGKVGKSGPNNSEAQDVRADQKGVSLVPPGLSLATMLDQQIGQIPKWAVANLAQRLTRVLVENLEVTKDFEMSVESGRVKVTLQDSIYSGLYEELRKQTRIAPNVGCPLCSAIACLLAKTTGRPVAFEGETVSENGSIMQSNYKLLSET